METTKEQSEQKKKIKGSIKTLKNKKSELKEQRKKINEKVKKASSKKSKKKKTKELKSDLKKIIKKERKVKERLKQHKAKLAEKDSIRPDGEKENATQKKGNQNQPESTVKKAAISPPPLEKTHNIPLPAFDPDKNSIDYNAKTAISLIRRISDINVLGEFISRDTRVTVQNAAKSRRNAIIRQDS